MAYDPNDPNQGSQDGNQGAGDYLSTDPYAGQQGAGTPGTPGAFDNQSTTSDPTAAAWKIGMAVPAGYRTFHPGGDPAKLAIQRIPFGEPGYQQNPHAPTGPTNPATPGAPTTPPAGTTGAGSAYGGGASDVDAWLAWMAQQPGHDPILDTPGGLAYYKQRISETGGLSASNQDYWKNKATLAANGGAVGAPEGGGTGSLWNKMPTLADIQGIPGYQEALAEGKRSYETGAASKGTILNGRTIAGEGAAVSNQVLSQFYFPYAQQNYLNNQGNANNLYNLANLGLNGSSVGAA